MRNFIPWVKALQKDLPELLRNLAVPTLIVRGAFDTLFSAENANAISETQPNAAILTIDGVGHLPQQEAPEAFNSGVKAWLNRTQTAPAK